MAMKRLLRNRRLPVSPPVKPWKKTRAAVTAEPTRTNRGRGEIRLAAKKTLPLGVGRVHETGSDLCADDVRRLETLGALEQVKLDCLALV